MPPVTSARRRAACLDIIRGDPRHFDALHLLGVICTNQGQHADGVSYLLRAEALQSNNGRLLANLGAAFGAVQPLRQSGRGLSAVRWPCIIATPAC